MNMKEMFILKISWLIFLNFTSFFKPKQSVERGWIKWQSNLLCGWTESGIQCITSINPDLHGAYF